MLFGGNASCNLPDQEEVTKKEYMDIGRQADLEYIAKRMPHAVGSEKDALERAVYNIMNENGYTRSMRESLIREMRQGRTANVRDIHEQISEMKARRDSRVI